MVLTIKPLANQPGPVHCKNELVILTLIWLQEFQCSIDNKYYACEV